jgi:hypothetical protein
MFAQTSGFLLHDYGISLIWGYERVNGSSTFCPYHFSWPINFNYISKDAGNSRPCDFPPFKTNPPPIPVVDLLQAHVSLLS